MAVNLVILFIFTSMSKRLVLRRTRRNAQHKMQSIHAALFSDKINAFGLEPDQFCCHASFTVIVRFDASL